MTEARTPRSVLHGRAGGSAVIRRKSDEWFNLDAADVRAFKRRKLT
jgi:hypothetical protein